jgi:hypothetical protein
MIGWERIPCMHLKFEGGLKDSIELEDFEDFEVTRLEAVEAHFICFYIRPTSYCIVEL